MKDHDDYKETIITILSMSYLAIKLMCNLVYLKHIEIKILNINLVFTGAALFYSSIYILINAIAFISNRKIATIIIIVGILFDGFYSSMIYLVSQLNEPAILSHIEELNNHAVGIISPNIFNLYVYGSIASIITSIAELFLFLLIMARINSFILSTIISTVITILVHNLITDGIMLNGMINKWNIISVNFIFNILILLIYSILISFSVNLSKRFRLKTRNSSYSETLG